MKIPFYKYEGAGNDFIIMDNRNENLKLSTQTIARLCNRRFGIGADGLMLLEEAVEADFKMIYFNSDGRESTFCGNGGRCLADFAYHVLKITGQSMNFLAIDGRHQAKILEEGKISLTMRPVSLIQFFEDGHLELDTGSPHYVCFERNVREIDVTLHGRMIRNLPQFQPKGINVNFLEKGREGNCLRTYERGVEEETFACGTGVTAAAIALSGRDTGHFSLPITTKAGHTFMVTFDKPVAGSAENITLTGPVKLVFSGTVEI